jgi:hypothetical protein
MRVTQDEVTVPMTDEQALKYLFWCQQEWMAGKLTHEVLGLAEGTEIKNMIISSPIQHDSSRIAGKNLFAVALSKDAATNPRLVNAVWRRICSRFLGTDIPEGLPRPRMILMEA